MDNKLDELTRKTLIENKVKSEDAYEKNITLITSGALVLSITLIDKVTPLDVASNKWILVCSWGALSVSLIINLVSHKYTSIKTLKTLAEHDQKQEGIFTKVQKRNKGGMVFDWFALGLLLAGLSGIVIFTSINIL